MVALRRGSGKGQEVRRFVFGSSEGELRGGERPPPVAARPPSPAEDGEVRADCFPEEPRRSYLLMAVEACCWAEERENRPVALG